MPNNQTQILRTLKRIVLSDSNVSLAIVKEYKKERISHYDIKYVQIENRLENRLRNIITRHINNSNTVQEYSYDRIEPEDDMVNAINYEETDFYRIYEKLRSLNPEEDKIESINELVKAKAYIIILRNDEGIQVVGFKTLPENWKMRKSRGLIPLLFKENRFEDLDEENIFSISNLVDSIYYNEILFILSKREFERGLNFREGMINNANQMYQEVIQLNLFINMDILTNKVGNNQRYLRKIAIIRNLGHYRNAQFLLKMQQVSIEKNWNIQFDNGQIVITDDTLEDILTILQNKRLHSEITDEDFDVESAKLL